MRGVIVVFAKAPRPGLVKTRMSPPLSPEEAAVLYEHLLDDALETTAQATQALGLDAVIALHPSDAASEIARRAPRAFRVVAQRGADLAERMTWAVAEAAATGASPILLRGSDSPALGVDTIARALEGLEGADLVVCPDCDGGYNLIGLRGPAAGLFDHAMSTGTVLADTLARAGSLRLRCSVLETGFDLDTVEDLRWLRRARRSGAALPCPRTLEYLDAEDLWRHLDATPVPRSC